MTTVDFQKLHIKEYILKVIEEEGFKSPTKIQNKAIPYTLANQDIIATAKTGSGKTLVYAIKLIQTIEKGKGVQGLVLVPTRELAKQVGNELGKFSKHKPLNIMVSYGGGSLKAQKQDIQNAEIIVGTPGRISDYVEQDLFQLGKIKTVVLDEVDSIIQKQFLNELNYILKTTPKSKQTLVFSATINKETSKLLSHALKNPKKISVDNYVDPKKLKQIYYEIESDQKLSLLSHLLTTEKAGLIIIFTNRQDVAEFIGKNLKQTNLKSKVVHGEMSQGKRNKIINDFENQKFDVLIATDIAARGLDIDGITHVYNYNIPKHSEKYIHRIGRTARAGEFGKIINLVSESDSQPLKQITIEHKIKLQKKPLPNFKQTQIKKEFKQKKHRR